MCIESVVHNIQSFTLNEVNFKLVNLKFKSYLFKKFSLFRMYHFKFLHKVANLY